MEIAGIRSADQLNAASAASEPTDELGEAEFMELFLAQLSNQDPLDPAKNEEFVAQLAQFSSLEGITDLNESMATVSSAINAQLTLQSASLVGRSVLVPTNQTYMEGAGFSGNIELSQATSSLSVEIVDQAGQSVRRLDLGTQGAGSLRFVWDGTDELGNPMQPGIYGVRASSLLSGENVEQTVELPERVVSVSLNGGAARVNLAGGTDVSVNEIREIQ
ncbi:MAG: flagellar hook assembly protein FlgD [Pseudomonadaceae bacterium]|nr:flagellar hook assembly protein FlgD [Pseudomonadaceae bacterium]